MPPTRPTLSRLPLGLLLAPLLGAGAGAGACFDSSFAAGYPCQTDRDCGPQLACVNGYCGGERPDESVTSELASTSSSGDVTTATATGATSEGATTGAPYACDKLDLLIVFDTSESMNQWDDRLLLLANDFLSFAAPLLDVVGSYHIGVVPASAMLGPPRDCGVPGALWLDDQQGPICASMAERRYLDESDPFDALHLGCLLRVGQGGPDEHPMLAVLEAVSNDMNAAGGCNEGFIRKDALLVVMLVTDEEDDQEDEQGNPGSPGDPQFWYEKLLFYKNGNEEALVFGALLGESQAISKCPWMLPEDKSEATVSSILTIGAEEGIRFRQFMDSLPVGHAYASSICDESYVSFYEQFFQEVVLDACEDFDPLATDPMVPDPTDP